MVTEMQKRPPPKSLKNKMFIFWWSTRRLPEDYQKTARRPAEDKQKTTRSPVEDCQKTARRLPEDHQKTARRPPDHQLSKSDQKTLTKMQKNEKDPLSHQKIKCSFLDYIQLLMIGQAIQAKNINQNAKKQKRPPKSSKKKMFIFGLCSTSDDWPSDLSRKCWPNVKK